MREGLHLGSLLLPHEILSILTEAVVIAETNDGAILFVFGDEAAAAAHQKEAAPEVEAEPALLEPAQPDSSPAEPVEQLAQAAADLPAKSTPAAQEAEPESAYETTRNRKVKEAVKEAATEHRGKTSGTMRCSSHFCSCKACQASGTTTGLSEYGAGPAHTVKYKVRGHA